MADNNKLQIRNSTVDFFVFTKDAHEDGIEVRVQDHNVWLTQKGIGQLFDEDYSVDSQITRDFFATAQNKMHYAGYMQGEPCASLTSAIQRQFRSFRL